MRCGVMRVVLSECTARDIVHDRIDFNQKVEVNAMEKAGDECTARDEKSYLWRGDGHALGTALI